MRDYDTMSELERREPYQMLAGLAAFRPIDDEVDGPDGTYYEYDWNLKATVRLRLTVSGPPLLS